MRVTLEPFIAEHGVEVLGKAAESMLDWLLKIECTGPAYTGRIADGRILGCAGVTIESQEIGNAWMLPSRLVPHYPVAFHKEVVRMFRAVLEQHPGLRYIHAHTDADYPERAIWIQRMGFQEVGMMDLLWPEKKRLRLFGYLVEGSNGRH